MPEKALILDTCALLWLASGDPKISIQTREQIHRASIVFVSLISGWEISIKYERQQLELPLEPQEWFTKAISWHSLVIAPLDLDILTSANKLPWHHRDPADRFIIATAIRENAGIVTADTNFSKYDVRVLI